MAIVKPAHCGIRTADLGASQRFYTDVLQLRVGFRPPFSFPGVWLYPDRDESGFGAVHLIGVDPRSREGLRGCAGEARDEGLPGNGPVDHIAFLATDSAGMRQRCDVLGIPYRVQRVPALDLIQVFLVDPSGVTIELNYRSHDNDFLKGNSQ